MTSSKTNISRRKRIFFRLLTALLPIALLLLIELVLRLCGFGGYAPFFYKVGSVPGGTLVVTDPTGADSWFFNSGEAGETTQYAFLDPKPTNTFRVFIVGGSDANGWPHPRNLASSAFLQARLQGRLTAGDRKMAAREIEQGQMLLQRGSSKSSFTEYYLARPHDVRGEYVAAIPLLNKSWRKLSGSDRLAVDRSLILSYLKTGATDQAILIAQDGVNRAGPYALIYRKLLTQIEALTSTNAPTAK